MPDTDSRYFITLDTKRSSQNLQGIKGKALKGKKKRILAPYILPGMLDSQRENFGNTIEIPES